MFYFLFSNILDDILQKIQPEIQETKIFENIKKILLFKEGLDYKKEETEKVSENYYETNVYQNISSLYYLSKKDFLCQKDEGYLLIRSQVKNALWDLNFQKIEKTFFYFKEDFTRDEEVFSWQLVRLKQGFYFLGENENRYLIFIESEKTLQLDLEVYEDKDLKIHLEGSLGETLYLPLKNSLTGKEFNPTQVKKVRELPVYAFQASLWIESPFSGQKIDHPEILGLLDDQYCIIELQGHVYDYENLPKDFTFIEGINTRERMIFSSLKEGLYSVFINGQRRLLPCLLQRYTLLKVDGSKETSPTFEAVPRGLL